MLGRSCRPPGNRTIFETSDTNLIVMRRISYAEENRTLAREITEELDLSVRAEHLPDA
jgi:hypothetical protein